MTYHFSKKTQLPFNRAVEKITEELKKEGFGVLTNIDMKEVMQQKIGKTMPHYVILGACNPQFAWKALQAEDKIGLLLPCNVVVQELSGGETEISIANPEEMMSHVHNAKLKPMATEVKEALERALVSTF